MRNRGHKDRISPMVKFGIRLRILLYEVRSYDESFAFENYDCQRAKISPLLLECHAPSLHVFAHMYPEVSLGFIIKCLKFQGVCIICRQEKILRVYYGMKSNGNLLILLVRIRTEVSGYKTRPSDFFAGRTPDPGSWRKRSGSATEEHFHAPLMHLGVYGRSASACI